MVTLMLADYGADVSKSSRRRRHGAQSRRARDLAQHVAEFLHLNRNKRSSRSSAEPRRTMQ